MTIKDITQLALENLWRQRLRAILTTMGVIIAIAAFVAMLSFGAGMQGTLQGRIQEFGLLRMMTVYPSENNTVSDSLQPALLTDSTLAWISTLDGVDLAFPLDVINLFITWEGNPMRVEAQTLPADAFSMQMFQNRGLDSLFASNTSRQAILSKDFVEDELGIEDPDSLIGKEIVISARAVDFDSAMYNVITTVGEIPMSLREKAVDAIEYPHLRKEAIRELLLYGISGFIEGMKDRPRLIQETVTIVAVLDDRNDLPMTLKPITLPVGLAEEFDVVGPDNDPASLLAAFQSGSFFEREKSDGKGYPRATVYMDMRTSVTSIADTLRAQGYRTYSLAEEFDDMRRFFVFFDVALGMIGFVALIIAALGIVNTMVMSILERRREIGVLKALGAEDRDVRILFLAESAMIGLLGSTFGIIFGWLITQIAELMAKTIFSEYMPPFDKFTLFTIPVWLILTALLFGLTVSLIAGLYPANRASRIDPVQALRAE